MRTRNRDTVTSEAGYQRSYGYVEEGYSSPGRIGGGYVYGSTEYMTYEAIVDSNTNYASKVGIVETMTDTDDGRGSYNEIHHEKTVWDFPLRLMNYKGLNIYSGRPTHGRVSAELSAGWDNLSGWATPTSWPSVYDDVVRATSRMRFGIQDAPVNLPTFLGELRDFREVFRYTFGKKRIGLSDLPAKYGKLKRYLSSLSGGETIRAALKTAISVDLTNKFAIQPLKRDLNSLRKANDHLVSQYSRLQRMRKHPVAIRGGVSHEDSVYNSNPTALHATEEHLVGKRIVTTWALAEYDLGDFPSIPSVMADMYGFDSWHETAWELTRLSFLLDYVIDIGGFLRQFRGDFIQIPYTILQEGYSVKTVVETTKTTHWHSGSPGDELWNEADDENRHCVGTRTESTYDRYKQPLPFGVVAPPQLKLPSLNQGLTALEVAYMLLSGDVRR